MVFHVNPDGGSSEKMFYPSLISAQKEWDLRWVCR